MNESARLHLVTHLIGAVPNRNRSLFRGTALGLLLFGIFEAMSLINQNVPRVPAVWILVLVVPVAQIMLFLKISQLLRFPRTENFYFVIGVSYPQRQQITVQSFRSIHAALLPFCISCALMISMLELVIIKERSIMNSVVVPLCFIALVLLVWRIGEVVLAGTLVRCSSKDVLNHSSFHSGQLFSSAPFAKLILQISHSLARLTPRSLRPLVIRNVLYLFRNDPLLFPLFIVAAPVLLSLVLLMIGDPLSPFLEFFTLLGVFVLSYYFANQLQDATLKLQECPWYEYSTRQFLTAFAATASILVLPFVVAYLYAVHSTTLTINGAVRVVTFFISLTVVLFTASRPATRYSGGKDTDIATDIMLFLGATLGCFVPLYGWFFSILVAAALILLQWELLCQSRKLPVDSGDMVSGE